LERILLPQRSNLFESHWSNQWLTDLVTHKIPPGLNSPRKCPLSEAGEKEDSFLLECRRQFLGIKTKGTGFGLESDDSGFIDEIKPVRPACVFLLHTVIDGVNQCWDRYVQFANAGVGNSFAICFGSGISEQDTFFHVALHLPEVAGMSLIDVNDEKCNSILILFIQFVERGNLPAKWRSSITAKNENHRSLSTERGQSD
jgi:hypothetical protein